MISPNIPLSFPFAGHYRMQGMAEIPPIIYILKSSTDGRLVAFRSHAIYQRPEWEQDMEAQLSQRGLPSRASWHLVVAFPSENPGEEPNDSESSEIHSYLDDRSEGSLSVVKDSSLNIFILASVFAAGARVHEPLRRSNLPLRGVGDSELYRKIAELRASAERLAISHNEVSESKFLQQPDTKSLCSRSALQAFRDDVILRLQVPEDGGIRGQAAHVACDLSP
ncbi:hypothetical protein SCHPADRAFT_897409 [Schizopora paradoxa]|uniref:Uncharacterized protein n=1 Tax=Schizopora paradoxa TaxID=27342 RepID=A0A0H2QYE5_9AGAM|nr:hypothetical protein SCHPADRAFT_897409 [Schizopora paradoxa]